MARAEKMKCTMCGEMKNPTRNFYQSYSLLYKGNNERMSICKDCTVILYEDLLKTYSNEKIAIEKLCTTLDIYFSIKAFEGAKQQAIKQESNLAKIYIQKINSMKQFNGLTNKDSDILDYSQELREQDNIDLGNINEDEVIDITITKDILKRWGLGKTKQDYFMLEEFYQDLIDSYEHKTPTQRWLYQEIASCRLEAEKCKAEGDRKAYAETMKMASQLMGDSNIKPAQKTSLAEEGMDNWGAWVSMIENNEPIGEAMEDYKDVDGIRKYINKWFVRPFGRALGLTSGDEILDYEDNN